METMIDQFIKDVDNGLSSYPKFLSSKYFYDKRGDELFVQIMHLPEYYLTEAELDIFFNQTANIIEALQLNSDKYFELIEFGAGDGLKTKKLLKMLCEHNFNFEYFPIDISQNALDNLEKTLKVELPGVSVKKKHGDYFEVLKALKDSRKPKVVLFLGSNIGNMRDEAAAEFIYELGSYLNTKDKLLIGVDLIKSPEIVLPAYSDSEGVTSQFNLNLLNRINRELGADFKLNKFYHQAEYSEDSGLAKSYLVSEEKQTVHIEKNNKNYNFAKGERILTEISRKYNDEIIGKIIRRTDFRITEKLSDTNNYFTDYVLTKF